MRVCGPITFYAVFCMGDLRGLCVLRRESFLIWRPRILEKTAYLQDSTVLARSGKNGAGYESSFREAPTQDSHQSSQRSTNDCTLTILGNLPYVARSLTDPDETRD